MPKLCLHQWEVDREHYTFFGYSHSTPETHKCILTEKHTGSHLSYFERTKEQTPND